jgi:hypothetical protein
MGKATQGDVGPDSDQPIVLPITADRAPGSAQRRRSSWANSSETSLDQPPAKAVLLEVVIETRDRSHLDSTIAALRVANIDVDVGGHS